MKKMIIKDIENLREKREQIFELQKQKEEFILKITKLSIYDANTIGNIIVKLMSEFEGISYQCTKDDFMEKFFLKNGDYIIRPKEIEKRHNGIYPNYQLKKFELKRESFSHICPILSESSLVFLPPSSFEAQNILKKESKDNHIFYLQYFIDFLYKKRAKHLLYEVTFEYLEMVLQEFLFITKDLQRQRKQERELKMKERLSYEKRRIFEKSCLIDRILIYNALMYIVNTYENDIVAFQECKEKWSYSMQWCYLSGYHNLIIQEGKKKFLFQAEVDHDGCYPDEEDYAVIDTTHHTKICFFDLKKSFLPIISKYQYLEMFVMMLEDLYTEKKNISADDIEAILVFISNDRKEKKRGLKLKHGSVKNK